MAESITDRTCERLLALMNRTSSLDSNVVGAAEQIARMQEIDKDKMRVEKIETLIAGMEGTNAAMTLAIGLALSGNDPADSLETLREWKSPPTQSIRNLPPFGLETYDARIDLFIDALEQAVKADL